MCLSCLPCKALQISLHAYGTIEVRKLGAGSGATAIQQESDSEVTALQEEAIVCALPPELLAEAVAMLPCSVYRSALQVSRFWHETLNQEVLWERLCRLRWPGVKHNMSHTWQMFTMQGGGDLFGSWLLCHLQNTTLTCTANTVAKCCLVESQGMRCDACDVMNLHGMKVYNCRTCNYNRCTKCHKALQPAAAITNGAVDHNSKDGWSALHFACRFGFTHVVNKLLDAQADIEVHDGQHGYTPLMVAATYGREKTCALLLQRGAAKGCINNYAKTAASCALSWGHADLGKLLGHKQ